MSEKPKPALTPEEWAGEPPADRWYTGPRYPHCDHDGYRAQIEPHYGHIEVFSLPNAESGVTVPERLRLPLAALCLHGRITWEMVDALRRVAYSLDDPPVGMGGMSFAHSYDSTYLRAIADLLESLLPPREL